jgi:hypothetical protein
MNTAVFQLSKNIWTAHEKSKQVDREKVQLVLCFGGKALLQNENIYATVRKEFPKAEISLCSTAGEIFQNTIQENSLVAVAMQFDSTTIKTASVNIRDFANSYLAATVLAKKLAEKDLAYIMVFSDGSLVNGSELVKGLTDATGKKILVTGGLAGDDANFSSTLVGLNEQPAAGNIVAIGFYGKDILVTHGSQGGWDIFGLEKRVTRSDANVLYEIEGANALELYKAYLGPEAENLPGAALLFPLSVIVPGAVKPVVRTILSIDEDNKTMTFAGDVPEGSKVRFMKANFDKLTHAASAAAEQSLVTQKNKPAFALLISCVGRKLILGQRTKEEIEAVSKTFADETLLAGFYSYGEISPFNDELDCQLHNQTMTITSFYES